MLAFFFFNDTATTEIYTLSLHDALPISCRDIAAIIPSPFRHVKDDPLLRARLPNGRDQHRRHLRQRGLVEERSEEHTSELQSRPHLVCRLLLEKKKNSYQSPMYRA